MSNVALSVALVAALLPFALTASACGKQVTIRTATPPAADLMVLPKPVPTLDILHDAEADARHNSAIETWGETGWAAVARLCRWALAQGSALPCPNSTD